MRKLRVEALGLKVSGVRLCWEIEFPVSAYVGSSKNLEDLKFPTYRAQVSRCTVQGLGFMVHGSGQDLGLGFWAEGQGFMV